MIAPSLVVTSAYLSLIPSHSYSFITSFTVYNALSTPTVDAASAGFIPGPRAHLPTTTTATRSLPAPVTRPSDLVLPYETDPSRLGSRAPSQATYTLTDTAGLTFAPIRAHMTEPDEDQRRPRAMRSTLAASATPRAKIKPA
ncbi:hypothetical protein GGG16DRAFT_119685 [Schizophyllum commune]